MAVILYSGENPLIYKEETDKLDKRASPRLSTRNTCNIKYRYIKTKRIKINTP